MTPRRTLIAWAVVLVVVHAVMSAWQPLQSDDWFNLLWDREHDAGWLLAHRTLNTILPYLFARSRAAFAAVDAAAALALVIGCFVLAMRRLPRDTWRDTLGVIAVSAMIWVAQPRAGFTMFHRLHAATQLVGGAIAVWLLAAFALTWRPRGRAAIPLVALAGLAVGTASHQLALGATVGAVILWRRVPAGERPRWMAVAIAALVVGAGIGFATPPYTGVARALTRGFELNLTILDGPVRANGKLVTGLLLLALARLAIPGATGELPAPRTTRAWIVAWLGLLVLALTGPRYTEPTAFPATLALVVGLTPYVAWLCETRAIRGAVIALVAVLHVAIWGRGLAVYARLAGEFADRMAKIHAAPPGGVATIAPYSQLEPSAWFFGEDWLLAGRQTVAIELFGLRDIAFDTDLDRSEDNPQIAVRAELTGLPDAARAAFVPAIWASDPSSAKNQIETLVHRLRRAGVAGYRARFFVDNLPFAERGARPLELAWYDRGELTVARASHSSPDASDIQ
ncbi:MAG TPA: DUF6056 family protein, partial [Kofleriaceae bacterium]|nr:DUF6056 family protein [Kofleriaceae bacterium]